MFDRLSIPTPFQVGRVNAYLADGTIVDPGPDSETARAAVADELAARDLELADVDRVLVTHPHPDHFGLANYLAEHGAEVVASAPAASVVQSFEERLEYEQTYFAALFEYHGMDPETAQTVTELPEAFLEYAPSVAVDRELGDGDALSIDGTDVTAREATGHSIGELVFEFVDAAPRTAEGGAPATADGARTAIVGDQVLPETTPNPFLQPPSPDGAWNKALDDLAALLEEPPERIDDARPRTLPAYNDSLASLRDADYDRLLPGHGEPIEDPTERIEALLAAHESRTETVRELIDGPTTAMDVLHGLFPDLGVVEYFGGTSEALGHLDVLVARGEVERRTRDGELVYESA